MEIPALLHATALPSRLSTKQSSGVVCPPTGQGERASLSRHVANTKLKFAVYNENKIAVSVIDKKSGDILCEIPHNLRLEYAQGIRAGVVKARKER